MISIISIFFTSAALTSVVLTEQARKNNEVVVEVPPVEQNISKFAEKEIKCLAENIYFEARSENIKEKMGVAHVTFNRLSSPKYPNTICGVVYEPKQFSWTSENSDYKKIEEKEVWEKIHMMAEIIYNFQDIVLKEDHTKGATHYYQHHILKGNKIPKWSKVGYGKITLAAHTYMKLPGGR